MRIASCLAFVALAAVAQACSGSADDTSTADTSSASGGGAGPGSVSPNGCDGVRCRNGKLETISCPGEPFTPCFGSSVQCVAKGETCPVGKGGNGGSGGSGGAVAGTGGAGAGGAGVATGGSGGGAGACTDVTSGAACDAAAPDCDLPGGLVASCVQGAWWVGTLAGPASDATPCSPYGTWALAYGPASGPSCGASKPLTMEIRPVHDGTKRAVRFGMSSNASLPLDGCSVTASSTVSFSGMGETGSSTVSVSVSFEEPVSGSFALSGTGFCGGENATGALTVTKKLATRPVLKPSQAVSPDVSGFTKACEATGRFTNEGSTRPPVAACAASGFDVSPCNVKRGRAYTMTARADSAAETGRRIASAAKALFLARDYEDVTLADVAAHADVTVQTVIRRFTSKEGLATVVADEIGAEIRSSREVSRPGDVAEAIRLLVASFETMGGMNWRLLRQEHRIALIGERLRLARAAHRAWIEACFAPLLPRRGPARERRVLQLFVATDFYAWKLLRVDLGLPRAQVERVMCEMATAIVGTAAQRVRIGVDGEASVRESGTARLRGRGARAARSPRKEQS